MYLQNEGNIIKRFKDGMKHLVESKAFIARERL